MNLPTLTLRNAFAARTRALLTVAGVAIASAAFGFLRTTVQAYHAGVTAASQDRLVVRNAASITERMPIAYRARIASVEGVGRVATGDLFGGIYKDPKNFFISLAVDAEDFLAVYPEFLISAEERAAWIADRSGCIVGDKLTRLFGWKLGDRITLKGTFFPGEWSMTIRGIYHPRDPSTLATWLLLHHARVDTQQAGVFLVGAGAASASRVAAAIDARLADGPVATRTESEKSFQMMFIDMAGQVLTILRTVAALMLLILALVLANAMATAVRERTSELAVMKALGFRARRLALMVAVEGALLGALGGALGLALCVMLVRSFAAFMDRNLGAFFPIFVLRTQTVVELIGGAIAIGLIASALPAWRAARIAVAQALRRVG
jgi:putative ABC transport system permease protein